MELEKLDFSESLPHGWQITKISDAKLSGVNSIDLCGLATDKHGEFQFFGTIIWEDDGSLTCSFIPDVDKLVQEDLH